MPVNSDTFKYSAVLLFRSVLPSFVSFYGVNDTRRVDSRALNARAGHFLAILGNTPPP